MRSAPMRLLPLIALGLAACDTPEPARRALITTGLATNAPEPKDFVRASRPGETAYRPVGVAPAPRALKVRDKKGVEELRKELEAGRDALQSSAGRPPAPKP